MWLFQLYSFFVVIYFLSGLSPDLGKVTITFKGSEYGDHIQKFKIYSIKMVPCSN